MFLEGDGTISTTNGGYGATSPTQLWDALKGYPNVVMTVLRPHRAGLLGVHARPPTATRWAMFLQAMHAPDTNPVRIVTVDTAAGHDHDPGAVELRPVEARGAAGRRGGLPLLDDAHRYALGPSLMAARPQLLGSVTSATCASRARTTSSAWAVAATPWAPAPIEMRRPATVASATTGSAVVEPNGVMVPRS